jgi:integrase
MATPKKTAQGTWRVQIEIKGVRDSFTGKTKREVDEWQARRKAEILTGGADRPPGSRYTLADAFREYGERVSSQKRGWSKELVRLNAFTRHRLPVSKPIGEVTTADLVAWRDERLGVCARGSVLRDMNLLGHVFETARREWQWIEKNPMKDVRRPQNPDHRKRVIRQHEIRGILRALGHNPNQVRSVSQAVATAFLFALSTGMRAGEICALSWTDVGVEHVHVGMSKTGDARDVPLSPVGQRLLERMKGWDATLVFGIKSQTLDALFRKARGRAKLEGFTFHDSRRTAATRLSGIINDPLMLCRIMGWRRTDQAMTYYAPDVIQIARLLR